MRDTFRPTTYLLASHRDGTLYVGATSKLMQRLLQHREGLIEGFTRDYGVQRLVRFGQHATTKAALLREKRIETWYRAWKIGLVGEHYPGWRLGAGLGLGSVAVATGALGSGGGDGFPPLRGMTVYE